MWGSLFAHSLFNLINESSTMSWLSKLLPPKINQDGNNSKSNVPQGLWCKCDGCNEILYHTDLDHNLKVCLNVITTIPYLLVNV